MTQGRNGIGCQAREIHAKVGEAKDIAKLTLLPASHARRERFRVDRGFASSRYLGSGDGDWIGFFRHENLARLNGGGSRQSAAYVFDVLAVLTVVPVARDDPLRIVSFRPASEEERSAYHDWLDDDFNGDQ